MTSKASAAGEVLAKLKVAIAEQGANSLIDKAYKVPKVDQAKKDLQEQETRMEDFTRVHTRISNSFRRDSTNII